MNAPVGSRHLPHPSSMLRPPGQTCGKCGNMIFKGLDMKVCSGFCICADVDYHVKYAPAGCSLTSLDCQHTADYFTKDPNYAVSVAMSVNVGLMCSHGTCRFYSLDDQWIKHLNRAQFRCPQCGQRYRRRAQGAVRYASITNPLTGLTQCFPCKWPQEAPHDGSERWLIKMVEVSARDVQMSVDSLTFEDLDAFRLKSALNLSNLLDRVAVPIGFQLLRWDSGIEYMLSPETFPSTQSACFKAGVWGMHMPPEIGIFDGWLELIGLLANIVGGAEAAILKLSVG